MSFRERVALKNDVTERSIGVYFPSKRDTWLAIFIWAPAFGIIPLLFISTPMEALVVSAILIPTYAFIAWIWFRTGYTLGPDELHVQSGPFRWRIKLSAITRVRASRNPLSSTALSLDRLEIRYDKFGVVLISPEEKERFLALIKERCPDAEFVLNDDETRMHDPDQ